MRTSIINHINLAVADVDTTADFFVRHFGFSVDGAALARIRVLKGEGGFVLVLSNLAGSPTPSYPKDFHIGFYQQDTAAVDQVYEALRVELGLEKAPHKIRDRYGFYFYAPGEILVEVTCHG